MRAGTLGKYGHQPVAAYTSQRALAVVSGMSNATVSLVVRGHLRPNPAILDAAEKLTGRSPEELFTVSALAGDDRV